MRNFSKTLISMAAVMAVGSAMAAGAMAETLTASYDVETGYVTITGAVANGASNTLLIVKGEANTPATEETIKQIDQVDEEKAFTQAYLGTGLVAGDTYELRLGGSGEGDIQTCVFTVPSKEEEVEYEPIVIGDVDDDGAADFVDITYMMYKDAMWDLFYDTDCKNVGNERTAKDGSTVVIGDVDDDGAADFVDITYMMYKDAMWDLFYDTDCKNVGEEIEVVVE